MVDDPRSALASPVEERLERALQVGLEVEEDTKVISKSRTPREELFNIDPVHRYRISSYPPMKPKGGEFRPLRMLDDIPLSEGLGYTLEKIPIKPGSKICVKKRTRLDSLPLSQEKISPQDTLVDILNHHTPPSWRSVFEVAYKDLIHVDKYLRKEEELGNIICPLKKNIFRAFQLCPLSQVKVIILGQDPYPEVTQGYPQANGLAFSTNKEYPVRRSLQNIYQELQREEYHVPNHGDLTQWARNGVLLLNTALTTVQDRPGAHVQYWRGFTITVLKALNKIRPKVVYLLWGRHAQEFKKYINDHDLVLSSRHPSPLSYSRNAQDNFIGNNHFTQANQILEKNFGSGIDWNLA